MSQLEVDKIIPQSGTTLTIGDSGDTITISSGAGFQSNGIYDNSSSTSLFINGSNRVTVGTDSGYGLDNSADDFVVANILSNSGMSIVSNASNSSSIFFTDTGVSSIGKIVYSHSSDDMKFTTANSEAMRINSSGNLLVGKTSQGSDAVGVENRGDGLGIFTRDGNTPVIINRKTSDGTVIDIKKDGTTVGSIGHTGSGGASYIAGSNNVGLQFNNVSDEIRPSNSDGSARDNAIDLGNATRRFKDLYLGGGLYVGGTAAANKLDDYEEGTWTPTLSATVNGFTGAPTPSSTEGKYTKIGKLVYLTGKINFASSQTHTAYSYINGLPFTTSGQQAGGVYNTQGAADGNATGFVRVGQASDRCSLVENDVAIGASTTFIFNVTYIAD